MSLPQDESCFQMFSEMWVILLAMDRSVVHARHSPPHKFTIQVHDNIHHIHLYINICVCAYVHKTIYMCVCAPYDPWISRENQQNLSSHRHGWSFDADTSTKRLACAFLAALAAASLVAPLPVSSSAVPIVPIAEITWAHRMRILKKYTNTKIN